MIGGRGFTDVGGEGIKGMTNTVAYISAKLLRLLVGYVALTIATNYMTQIYVEKVFVNDENPQALHQSLVTWLIIDIIFNVLIVGTMIILVNQDEIISPSVVVTYVTDLVIQGAMLVFIGWIISDIMYKKKYFLYKEDGLRAIRAFQEIMFKMIVLMTFIPHGAMATSLLGSIVGNSE